MNTTTWSSHSSLFSVTTDDSHVSFLCVEHDVLVNFGIMAGAILFFVAMFVLVLCLLCRSKARQQEETLRLSRQRIMKKIKEDQEALATHSEEEESV